MTVYKAPVPSRKLLLGTDDEVEGVSKIRRMPSRCCHSADRCKKHRQLCNKEPAMDNEQNRCPVRRLL